MERIQVTTDADGLKIMTDAAAYAGAPLSIWARMVLLNEARAVIHKKKCETPAGVKDTRSKAQKLHDVVSARLAAERDAEKLPDEVAAQLAAMDASEDAV